jgi:hypothetical protein
MTGLKKTGQMEMIGLVLIVFLLSLGMFFLVFISNKENTDSKSLNPQNVDLAQNMIDAIKYTKLDCPPPYGKKTGIDDLIIDMATDKKIFCSGVSSQDYTKTAISNMLNQTLGVWSKSYAFAIIKNEGKNDEVRYLSMSTYNCTMNSVGKEGSQPFPLRGAGTVTMKLHICS